MIGVSRQAVSERVHRGTLLALAVGRGGYHFPLFQFGVGGRPLAGLSDVISAFHSEPRPVETNHTIAAWLVTPQAELEGSTPVALLRRGQAEAVRAAALRYTARLRR